MTSTRAARVTPLSQRRAEILAIAAQLIATRGYSATTVRHVADEAGILSGSLYHHFVSKESILEELLRQFMTELLEGSERIATGVGSPREVLDRLVDLSFHTIGTQPDLVRIYQQESEHVIAQPGFEFVAEYSTRMENIWLGAIRQGQQKGDFRDALDPSLTYRFIRDAVWATARWFRPEGKHTTASLSAQFRAFLHHGLLSD